MEKKSLIRWRREYTFLKKLYDFNFHPEKYVHDNYTRILTSEISNNVKKINEMLVLMYNLKEQYWGVNNIFIKLALLDISVMLNIFDLFVINMIENDKKLIIDGKRLRILSKKYSENKIKMLVAKEKKKSTNELSYVVLKHENWFDNLFYSVISQLFVNAPQAITRRVFLKLNRSNYNSDIEQYVMTNYGDSFLSFSIEYMQHKYPIYWDLFSHTGSVGCDSGE